MPTSSDPAGMTTLAGQYESILSFNLHQRILTPLDISEHGAHIPIVVAFRELSVLLFQVDRPHTPSRLCVCPLKAASA